ncbi:hypothetical protein PMIN01_08520 [Paraphaeosphaeria minitans]|uniref:Uncharacterized protein n=1 Tax=Paraphaeosphaeria minitans TaxID=565426 RepID=A0A9P6GEB3_9PLEO|nr:hypothetical protein PMIN01_08520 [Paraphaeosphaeria minitans]
MVVVLFRALIKNLVTRIYARGINYVE